MSDIKRATLISFGADKGDEKKQKLVTKSVRISFILPESNEGTCPVYNYKEELAAAKKKDKSKQVQNGKQTNGLDPFDEDDDDVRRIAQEMEAKYGMGPPEKKKRKGRKDDYADIGMGYDESDSFIDNTDGYDEIIPQNVTTLHGGFYINCGALEFKTDDEASSEVSSSSSASSSSDDEEDDEPQKTSRKRILDTTDSEGETETEKSKDTEKGEKKKSVVNGMPPMKKKKLLVPDKIKQLKKDHRVAVEDMKKKTVKDLLKEKREEVNVQSEIVAATDKSDKGEIEMKENKNPKTQDSQTDVIESVAKGNDNNNKNGAESVKDIIKKKIVQKEVPNIPSLVHNKQVLVPSSEGENSRDSLAEPHRPELVQLPENLPDNIVEIVNKIKDTALKNSESNSKIFTHPVNMMLLSLERKCKCLGKQSRGKIYQHLAPLMKCRKETIIRRAKNLVLEDDLGKIKRLVTELKSQIDLFMPQLLEHYERESQKIVQKKFSKESNESEENKQLRMPKRKFIWTDGLKKILKEIVTIRRRCYLQEGKNKESVDIQMNLYLKSEIQILWPDGWMSMAALLKIYNNFNDKKSPLANRVNPMNKDGASRPPLPVIDAAKLMISKEGARRPSPGIEAAKLNTPREDISRPSQSSAESTKFNTNKGNPPVPNRLPTKISPSKELQKLASNTMLSITPVVPKSVETKPKPPKNDLTINKIEQVENSSLSIKPTKDKSPVRKPKTEETPTIKPIQTETLLIPQEHSKPVEKTTKFIHLPQSNYKPESNPIKPIKPPTDHKIENIMKPCKSAETSPTTTISPITPKQSEAPKHETKPENLSKPKHDKPEVKTKSDHLLVKRKVPELPRKEEDVIILDDEDRGKPSQPNVIDLTSAELRRKPGPKSKTKYYDPSLIKPVKSATILEAGKPKPTMLGNKELECILQENIAEAEQYFKKKARMHENNKGLLVKGPNDGDDIQKVMEDLKVLQKMSAPAKNSGGDSLTSSPVSVIAFNKTYTPKTSPAASPSLAKQETLGFQDAFQRQFLNDLKHTMSGPTSSKNYNSAHASSTSGTHPEKYYTNANNNYTQQNASKYKANFTSQQANHKPKPPQK